MTQIVDPCTLGKETLYKIWAGIYSSIHIFIVPQAESYREKNTKLVVN